MGLRGTVDQQRPAARPVPVGPQLGKPAVHRLQDGLRAAAPASALRHALQYGPCPGTPYPLVSGVRTAGGHAGRPDVGAEQTVRPRAADHPRPRSRVIRQLHTMTASGPMYLRAGGRITY